MILADDPIDLYHGRLRESPPTYSHTSLRFGQEHGMLALRRLMDGLLVIEDKECWALGRLFETRLCHGRDFYLKCCAFPQPGKESDGRTVEGKAFRKANAGKVILDAEEDAMIEDMVLALQDVPQLGDILAMEQQLTIQANIGGVAAQIRPDFIRIDGSHAMSVNLKTCDKLRKVTSGRDIVNFSYHTAFGLERAVLGANGITLDSAYILAVEKSNPSRAALLELSPMFVDLGEYDVRTWIDTVKACTDSGVWPRVAQTSYLVEPPAWLTKE